MYVMLFRKKMLTDDITLSKKVLKDIAALNSSPLQSHVEPIDEILSQNSNRVYEKKRNLRPCLNCDENKSQK